MTAPVAQGRALLMLVTYIPVHVALDIIVLTNFTVPGSAVYIVFVVNVLLALAIVWVLFWAIDRVRPHRNR